jgi:hypothetical protein
MHLLHLPVRARHDVHTGGIRVDYERARGLAPLDRHSRPGHAYTTRGTARPHEQVTYVPRPPCH